MMYVGFIFVILEVFLSLILISYLPSEVPITFSALLTSGVTQGSKWYLLALPTASLVFVGGWYYLRRGFTMSRCQNTIAVTVTSLVCLVTLVLLLGYLF